jgi:ZIP family zinc transporter
LGILIPLLGTTLGAGLVLLLRSELRPNLQKIMLGFASGVMIAASFWSLLVPSIDMARQNGDVAWVPAAVGFLLGIGFLLLMDSLVPHLHLDSDRPEGLPSHIHRNTMLMLAVTIHNIPEGMAVGVVFAGLLAGCQGITLSMAIALSIGIAIQNIPEGAIISVPLRMGGVSRSKAFLMGTLSGVVEPVAGLVTILLFTVLGPGIPYFLAFAAGAMIYVVVEELIPELQAGDHSNIGVIGVALGFVLMMILDVALG